MKYIGFPSLLMLIAAAWGVRAHDADLLGNDEARHAMNGAFIYDCFRSACFSDASNYFRQYYGRLPALSFPYHPPIFPVLESIFYAVWGVNPGAARAAEALTVAVSALIFYALVIYTHQSAGLAAACVLLFLFLPESQSVGGAVMLEFPALVFVFGSMYALALAGKDFAPRYAVISSVLAGFGFWTKQTLFLGMVPVVLVILQRRGRLLRQKGFWLWMIIFSIIVGIYAGLLMSIGWYGFSAAWSRRSLGDQLVFNLLYYARSQPVLVGALLFIGAYFAIFLRICPNYFKALDENHKFTALYGAWAISALALPVLIPAQDLRYTLFAFPPIIVLCAEVLITFCSGLVTRTGMSYVLLVAVLMWIPFNIQGAQFLTGLREAAETVMQRGAERILFCGGTNGQFIFEIRRFDPRLRTVVLRGDKLEPEVFNPASFREFALSYGIQYIVLQRSGPAMPWDRLCDGNIPWLVLERQLPLVSSSQDFKGTLLIYRFTERSEHPMNHLTVPNYILGRSIELKF